MTLQEIKQAVIDGKSVHWKNVSYAVQVDRLGQWFIVWHNRDAIGLTYGDGVTLNGDESEFFIGE